MVLTGDDADLKYELEDEIDDHGPRVQKTLQSVRTVLTLIRKSRQVARTATPSHRVASHNSVYRF
jgi:hypothetical protein